MELFKLLGTIAIETNDVEGDLERVTREARNTGDGFNDLDTKAKKLSNGGFTILKGVASDLISSGFQRLISAMGDLISSGVDYSNQIEQYQTSFETMTGSAEKAAEITERLQGIGASTPFELTNLADTTQLLMNYGLTADDAIGKMTMLGDISQGSSEKMTRIATAYGQMSSAGKVSLEDVKQMIEAGFNPLLEISESTGESMESLYDRISDGTISVDEITASMERSTTEGGKYFGSMDAQSQTFNGRLSTLKDTANESFGNIIAPLLQKAADEWFPAVTEAVSTVDEKFQAFLMWVSENKTILILLGTAIGVVTTALTVQAAVQAVQTAMNIAETASLSGLIAAKLASAAATVAALAPYLAIAAAIAAVIAIIVLCVKHWDEIKAKVIEVAQNIAEKIEELKENLSVMWTTIMSKALALWESIRSGIQQKVENIKTSVQEKFQNVKDTIEEKITAAKEKVTDIFTNIKDTIEEKINFARDKVEEAIEKIKGFFDFEWKLPDIKLPHFKKIGETELGLPKIGVEWYAKGGVLNKPTIFGMNPATGNAMVGGEAGAEAVAPIDVLQGYVAEAVASQNAGMVIVLERILDAILAMDENMGGNLRDALDGTAFKINNREFGRLVRSVV